MSFLTMAGVLGMGKGLLQGFIGKQTGQRQQAFGSSIYNLGRQQLGYSTGALQQGLGVLDQFDPRRSALASFEQTGAYKDRGQIDAAYRGLGPQNLQVANMARETMNRRLGVALNNAVSQGQLARAQGYRDFGNSFAQNAQPLMNTGAGIREAGFGTEYNAMQGGIGDLFDSALFMHPKAGNFFGLNS